MKGKIQLCILAHNMLEPGNELNDRYIDLEENARTMDAGLKAQLNENGQKEMALIMEHHKVWEGFEGENKTDQPYQDALEDFKTVYQGTIWKRIRFCDLSDEGLADYIYSKIS